VKMFVVQDRLRAVHVLDEALHPAE
jgi:hypothetical protein